MSGLAVDASVAVKWFLPEVHGSAALRILERGDALVTPDLLFAEVGSVLWKRVRRGQATIREAGAVLEALVALPFEVHPSRSLMPLALEIAVRVGQTVYDSLYVAVAVLRRCPLVTADRRLYEALRRGPFSTILLWVADVS